MALKRAVPYFRHHPEIDKTDYYRIGGMDKGGQL